MIGFARDGFPGHRFLTRASDSQCPRIDPCGYRCEAGGGGHEGPHLFEEHEHSAIARREPLDVERLARALPDAIVETMAGKLALARILAAEYARLEDASGDASEG